MDTLLSVFLTLSAAGYLLLGIHLIAAKREVGSVPVGVLSVVVSVWVMGGAVELMSTTFMEFSIGRACHFVGTALAPVVTYVAFREFTGADTPVRMIVMLLIIPVISVTIAATNSFHELMWYLPATNDQGQFLTRPNEWGKWFLFVHAPYSYLVLGAAMLKLMAHSSAVAPAHRRGLFLNLAACLVPLVAAMAYDFGIGPNTVSFVPIVFAAMLPFYAWLIIGEKIIEFTPLAYETVFQNMQDPVIVIDDQLRIIGLNHGAERLLDINENDALRAPLDTVFDHGSTCVFDVLETGEPQNMITSTGRFLHVQVSRISTTSGSLRGGQVLMFRDVSDVELAQREVRKSEKLLRTLIDHSVNGIIRLRWVHDQELGRKLLLCIFANAAAGRFLSVDPDTLVDKEADHIIQLATTGMEASDAGSVLRKFLDVTEAGTSIDTEVRQGRSGPGRWLRMICEPVGDDFALTLVDVTDDKAKERQMESIARSDPLTGVLNRRGFEREATQRLVDSDDDATGALLFMDLNDFKQINDRCGHEVGDQLLTIAAERLRKSLRSCDIIGRPGGDEFVALVPDVSGELADKLAKRLTAALEEPYMIGDQTLQCSASIGLALYPEHASTLTGLLREADQAMYRAKARSRDEADTSASGLLEKAMRSS
ncbi:MAG: diguanylate cyclase [Proteobacteria bacterium]|nr:diguanylate cyclase [Pseudomonadota bacterium]